MDKGASLYLDTTDSAKISPTLDSDLPQDSRLPYLTRSRCTSPVTSSTSSMVDHICHYLQMESTENPKSTCSAEGNDSHVNASLPTSPSFDTDDHLYNACTSQLDKAPPEKHPSLPLENAPPISMEGVQAAFLCDDNFLSVETDSSETASKPALTSLGARVGVFQGSEQKDRDDSAPSSELQNPCSCAEDSHVNMAIAAEGDVEEGSARECPSLRKAADVDGVALTDEILVDLEQSREGISDESSRESSVEAGTFRMVQNLRVMDEQQRFLRLQHLLKQSNIYSKFLLQRMEDQSKEKERVEQKRKQARKKRAELESKDRTIATVGSQVTSQRVTRMSLRSPASPSFPSVPPTKKAKGSPKSCKKTKAAEANANFDITEFMDGKGKLKQMKLTSKGEDTQVKDWKLAKSEDDLEERYFEGQIIPFNQPRLVTGGIMRSYQLDGMEWLKSLYDNGVNGILGDEMGLGKTLQCIAFISYLIEQGVKGPFLVAAPLSTIPNWVAEFKQFTPRIPVVLYHGSISEREDIRRNMFAHSRVGRFSGKSKKTRNEEETASNLLPVVVTSYHICMKDQHFLQNRQWKFLVVDEGHRIKNLNCKLIKCLKAYDSSNRLLLTGTPLQNNLAELWSLLNFLLPGIFNDLNSFQTLFDFDVTAENDIRERIIAQEREMHVLSTLHQILTPFLLRRLKSDVEFSLPPKKEILVYAPLTHFQEKYYKSLLDNTVFEMMEKEGRTSASLKDGSKEIPEDVCVTEKRSTRKRKIRYTTLSDNKFMSVMDDASQLEQILPVKIVEEKKIRRSAVDIKLTAVFVMLRKCINHPYLLEFPLMENGEFLVDEKLVNCCGKMMILDKMLLALIKDGHKVLIFSQFTRMLDVLEDYLDLRGLDRGRLDGSMSFTERQEAMTKFKERPDCMIFLLSTRAGGLGINLTSADTVIIYDSDWNPQCDLQAQDRCHRIGQTKPVMVYRLVTANTIDQRIVERASSKRRLEKMVIHKGKFKGLSSKYDLSIDDLIDLLHSADHEKIVNNQDAVISDEALVALLDRTVQSEDALTENKTTNINRLMSTSNHSCVFKVIAERDSSGTLMSSDNVCSEIPDETGALDALSDLCTATKDTQVVKDSGCEVSSSSSNFSSISPEPPSSNSRKNSHFSQSITSSPVQQPQT